MTQEKLNIWKERAQNGPYKISGDVKQNSPGDWQRIADYKSKFLKDNLELWSGSFSQEPLKTHHNLLAASFYNLLFPEQKLSDKIKTQIIQQVERMNWKNYDPASPEFGETGFIHAQWLTRFFHAYKYSEGLFNSTEKEKIKQWFLNAGHFFTENVNLQFERHLPNRENEDYSVKKGVFNINPGYDGYVYVNEQGQGVYRTTHISKWYNNRRASKLQPAGLIGIHYGDQKLIKHAKMFFKEWMMFGVYPDGTLGEYERNHDRNPQQGLVYGIVTQEVLIQWAYELWRRGDSELFEYTTSDGFLDSKGGKKNLLLTIKAYCEQATHLVKRYYKEPKPEYLIDTSSPSGENWAFEVVFSMANQYYKDPFIRQVYSHTHPNFNKWLPFYSGSGPIPGPWRGNGATIPGYMFMYGGIEDVVVDPEVPTPDPEPEEEPQKDQKLSSHRELKEALEAVTGVEMTSGMIEVWQRPDGSKYIKRPNIEIK